MNRSYQRRRSGTGFTLVEVLVALTLFGLILGSVYSGLYVGGLGWSRLDQRQREADDRRLVPSVLRRLIGQAVPLSVNAPGSRRVAFRGERESLDFVSALPAHAGGSTLNWLNVAVEARQGKGPDLVLRYLPLVPDGQGLDDRDFSTAPSVILVRDVTDLRFDYFGTGEEEDTPRWWSEWQEPSRLPDLVQVEVVSRDGTMRLTEPVRAQLRSGQPQMTLLLEPRW